MKNKMIRRSLTKKMRLLEDKIVNCNKCERFRFLRESLDWYSRPEIGTLFRKQPILLVGRNPGSGTKKLNPLDKNYFLRTERRKFVKHSTVGKFFKEFNLTLQDAWLVNLVKGKTLFDESPTKLEIQNCLVWLKKQIRLAKPKLVVGFGQVVNSTLFPNAEFGKLTKTKLFGIETTILPTYHPSYLFRLDRKRFKEEKKRLLQRLKRFRKN